MVINDVYIVIALLVAMVLPFMLVLNRLGEITGATRVKYDPKVISVDSMDVLRDMFRNAYESTGTADRLVLKSLYISVVELSLEESISAMNGVIRAESSGVKVILINMITTMMFNNTPDIEHTILAYGTKIAALHGTTLADLVKDIPSDTAIENPALLLSMAIILTTTDVVSTSES